MSSEKGLEKLLWVWVWVWGDHWGKEGISPPTILPYEKGDLKG